MARATSELEDEWNLLNEADKNLDSSRLDILTRWFNKSTEIVDRVEKLVPVS
jgi:uncharacterized protein YijF (DUF1287 family)